MTKTIIENDWLVWVRVGENETVHANRYERDGDCYVFFDDAGHEVCRFLASNIMGIGRK